MKFHLKWHIWPAIQLAMGLLAAIAKVATEKHRVWDPRCAQGAKNYIWMMLDSRGPTYHILKNHQVKNWNSWCKQKKTGHLIRFCKKSLFAWSRLLRSLIDVLRLDLILHFNRFFKIRTLNNLPPVILRPTSEYSCGGTNCSHYTHVTTTTGFSLRLCSFMFCSLKVTC